MYHKEMSYSDHPEEDLGRLGWHLEEDSGRLGWHLEEDSDHLEEDPELLEEELDHLEEAMATWAILIHGMDHSVQVPQHNCNLNSLVILVRLVKTLKDQNFYVHLITNPLHFQHMSPLHHPMGQLYTSMVLPTKTIFLLSVMARVSVQIA